MPRAFAPAPRWSSEELLASRIHASNLFVEGRRSEGPRAYEVVFRAAELEVRELFGATNDLLAFTGAVFEARKSRIEAARYLAGPPISADDLRTLVGDKLGKRTLEADVAQAVADAIRLVFDPVRFPWLTSRLPPSEAQRDAAVNWTSGLLAVERFRTSRRTTASRQQEDVVADALRRASYEQVARGRVGPVSALDQLVRGTFTRETKVAGVKCDVPVRLHDGRLLAVECKVSNSGVNSWKRLVRETGGKAERWQHAFGAQVLTAAVLAGIYDLPVLLTAQDLHGVTLFWQHDLMPFEDFVDGAR